MNEIIPRRLTPEEQREVWEFLDFMSCSNTGNDLRGHIAALTANCDERDRALVEAAFSAGAAEMAKFGVGLENNPEPNVAAIIEQVDRELSGEGKGDG